jgi:glycosyltransferase involved in cell wall biosynthesis
MKQEGISVIICCYNSATRLPATLSSLAKQRTSYDWELVVVDNASSDNTSEVARKAWETHANKAIPFVIVSQPLPGLSHAREKGIETSCYDYILFCDDDNHFAPDYIEKAYRLMEEMPEVTILGGLSKPKLAYYPGKWIEDMYPAMAIGARAAQSGYTDWVFGAGMVVRRTIFTELADKKINFLLSDRIGSKQTSGGDVELCYLGLFLGYKIYYSSELVFEHYMEEHRLKKSFFMKGHQEISPVFYLYILHQYIKGNRAVLEKDKEYIKLLWTKLKGLPRRCLGSVLGKHRFYSYINMRQDLKVIVWLIKNKKQFEQIKLEIKANLSV